MTKLKIALCISGQLRKLPRTKLGRIANALNADVYIHTWDHDQNPHLKDVDKYFPNAKVEVEKYEDVFDNILHDKTFLSRKHRGKDIGSNRYDYAQMYTVAKSLHLCKTADKDYDLVLRCRTDADLPMGVYTDDKNFNLLIEKINSILINHNVHSYHYRDRKIQAEKFYLESSYKEMSSPFVATMMNSQTSKLTNCQDWFFILNKAGLERMCLLTPEEYVMASHTHKLFYQLNTYENLHDHDPAMKTPSVFWKLWQDLGMVVLTNSDFIAGIMRDRDAEIVPHYGDVS